MIVSGQLVLAAVAQRLSNAYGGGSLGDVINPAQDLPLQELSLFADAADAFLGQDSTTTSTIWGGKVDSTDLQPVRLSTSRTGAPIKLSDLWVAGAGSTLHFVGVVQ